MSDTTFARLLATLQMIPANGTVDTNAIADRLVAEGYECTVRTVQRDLTKLEAMPFGLECLDDSKPFRWRFQSGRKPIVVPGLDAPQALALLLVETYLKQLVPRALATSLRPHFQAARQALDGKPVRRWLDQVRVVSRSQPLLPPTIVVEVLDAVHMSLMERKSLKVVYERSSGDYEMLLHPLGLISRDSVSYLAAMAFEYEDVRLYALHRMRKATRMEEAARTKSGFHVDAYLEQGELGWRLGETPINVELHFYNGAEKVVTETPLTKDQVITPINSDVVAVKAKVVDTKVFRSWLLSFGPNVEVRKPKALRRAVFQALHAAHDRYVDDI